MRTIISLFVFVSLAPLLSQAQSYEPCVVKIVTLTKDLKFTEARRLFHNGDCDFRYKDEFGETVSISKEVIKDLIDNVDNAEQSCNGYKSKSNITDSTLSGILSACGSKSWLKGRLIEAEKFSGVQIAEFSKRWDKFVDETRAAQEQKEKDEELAEEKYKEKQAEEAQTPEAFRQRTCQTYNIIEMAKQTIKKEKAAAKHSGLVDKEKMYSAGQYIENYSSILEKQKVEYKKKTGKEWSTALCK